MFYPENIEDVGTSFCIPKVLQLLHSDTSHPSRHSGVCHDTSSTYQSRRQLIGAFLSMDPVTDEKLIIFSIVWPPYLMHKFVAKNYPNKLRGYSSRIYFPMSFPYEFSQFSVFLMNELCPFHKNLFYTFSPRFFRIVQMFSAILLPPFKTSVPSPQL